MVICRTWQLSHRTVNCCENSPHVGGANITWSAADWLEVTWKKTGFTSNVSPKRMALNEEKDWKKFIQLNTRYFSYNVQWIHNKDTKLRPNLAGGGKGKTRILTSSCYWCGHFLVAQRQQSKFITLTRTLIHHLKKQKPQNDNVTAGVRGNVF